jgi:hypothetical protein
MCCDGLTGRGVSLADIQDYVPGRQLLSNTAVALALPVGLRLAVRFLCDLVMAQMCIKMSQNEIVRAVRL